MRLRLAVGLVGTLLGERLMLGISPARFRLLVSLLIGLLGISLLARAWWSQV